MAVHKGGKRASISFPELREDELEEVVASQAVELKTSHDALEQSQRMATLGTLVVALPLFFVSWWMADGHWPDALPERAVAATVYLGAVGSVLGFALYYYMIKHMEAGRIALITLITPVLALLLGHGLNDEAVLPQVWLGTASILLGLCLHRWGESWTYALMRRG